MKHFHFSRKGVEIDIHKYAHTESNPFKNKKIQKWISENLDNDLSCKIISINNVDVKVPSDNFNSIYLFLHILRHFNIGGIGLRQICDWIMLLHKANDSLDLKYIETYLDAFKIKKYWQTFGWIGVDLLGLPKKEMHFYSENYIKQAKLFSNLEKWKFWTFYSRL